MSLMAVVYKDHTLGLLGEAFGARSVQVLNSKRHKSGICPLRGPLLFVNDEEIKPATLKDFETFKVVYNKGYRLEERLDELKK